MKLVKFAALIITLAVLFYSCSQKTVDEVTETYPDGSPKVRITFTVDGETKLKEKIAKYYESGNLEYTGTFDREGKRHGKWTYYYQDGKIWSEAAYQNGERHGPSAVYFQNGNKRYEGNYLHNSQTGKWLFYDEQGKLVKELNY